MATRYIAVNDDAEQLELALAMIIEMPRKALTRLVECVIDRLDLIDAPSEDLEPNGDQEGACDEDEISTAFYMTRNLGPGCPYSDEDVDAHYRPAARSIEGRAFINARRSKLGLSPLSERMPGRW
ncbi:hypothetical protein A4X03_0g9578 [Tilletia caries]|uniref:Uncharacterized protein n=1 Tax=Tilletia caries TaxID=13290 RepID=A0A8T8SAN7_9BASI|nr:hypothetical protein A4X03_0g9578 [Tilletia caries]